jgi:membrane protease YdiL (CAAX protease family)
MKKCSYCGREYPDDAVRCLIDENPLSGGLPDRPVEDEISVLGPVFDPPKPSKAILTDRQMEIIEVILVCVIAFGVSILGSIFLLFNDTYGGSTQSGYAWAAQALRDAASLALVWYLLQRRGKAFSDLGLRWSPKDFGWSVILALAGDAFFRAVYDCIYYSGIAAQNREAVAHSVGHLLFGGGIFFSTVLVQLINPFYEELIVRAYLMTQVKRLTNSVTKAVLISTLLQTSYHFYQGAPAAIAHGATFLIFSIYYAKTNRIAPIILAHLYMDVGGTLEYWLRS